MSDDTDEALSDVEKLWERKDHPLLNDVILLTLFEFMNLDDLKECRLVCKKWCELTLTSARSKFWINVNGIGEENPKSVTNFVEVFRENTLGIPFARYKLDPFYTTEGPGQEFLQICGSTAKRVSLTAQDQDHSVSTVEVEDISEFLKAMPNLELFYISHRIRSRSGNVVKLFPDDSTTKPKLTCLKVLVLYDLDAEETIEYCPTFIEEILSIAPDISEIRVQDSIDDPGKSRIGQVFRAIERFKRESIITNLRLGNALDEHVEPFRRLANDGMKLKELDFSYAGEEHDPHSVQCLPLLATLFKNSIEHLCVSEVCHGFLQLPIMPKLEKLEFNVAGYFDSKSVNLKKLFPALKELDMFYWTPENGEPYTYVWEWEEFLPNSEPCPNVNSFCLGNVGMKIQLFDHVLNIFPKLTTLELDLDIDGAQILMKIMTEMTQLESLSVEGMLQGVDNIDAFLTGIPVHKVLELQQVVTELKEMSVQLRVDTIQEYRTRYCEFSSITNLTNLKRLHLGTAGRNVWGWGDTRMTDVLAFFGLYSMKHINKLQIEDCRLTKSGCEILTAEMGLKSWSITDADDVDIIPEFQFP